MLIINGCAWSEGLTERLNSNHDHDLSIHLDYYPCDFDPHENFELDSTHWRPSELHACLYGPRPWEPIQYMYLASGEPFLYCVEKKSPIDLSELGKLAMGKSSRQSTWPPTWPIVDLDCWTYLVHQRESPSSQSVSQDVSTWSKGPIHGFVCLGTWLKWTLQERQLFSSWRGGRTVETVDPTGGRN